MAVHVCGFASALYGWIQRRRLDGLPPDAAAILNECASAGLDAVEIDPTPDVLPLLRSAGLRV